MQRIQFTFNNPDSNPRSFTWIQPTADLVKYPAYVCKVDLVPGAPNAGSVLLRFPFCYIRYDPEAKGSLTVKLISRISSEYNSSPRRD